jgi:hypothetical protein
MQDPRIVQISVLASLMAYGLAVLGFDQSLASVGTLLTSALITQLFWAVARREDFDPRSALISVLSLCLPASRPGRLIFAKAVVSGAFVAHSGFYESDGPLFPCSPVPSLCLGFWCGTETAPWSPW